MAYGRRFGAATLGIVAAMLSSCRDADVPSRPPQTYLPATVASGGPSKTTPAITEDFKHAEHGLRVVAAAIWNYHADRNHAHLPPGVLTDARGGPWSWRVYLLPYLTDMVIIDLDPQQPWDSPANLKAAREQMPDILKPPASRKAEPGMTYYRVFIGDATPFPPKGHVTLDQIHAADGLSKTILLVEADEPVFWTNPKDLVYDPSKPLPKLGGHYGKDGFLCLTCDRTVQFLSSKTDPEVLRALIQWNDKKEIQQLPLAPR